MEEGIFTALGKSRFTGHTAGLSSLWRYVPFHWQRGKEVSHALKKIPLETFQPILDKDWEGCHQLMARRRKLWIRKQLTRRNHLSYGKDFPLNYKFSTRGSFQPVAFERFCCDI